MRAAMLLCACLLGCGRTTLDLSGADESSPSATEPGACPAASAWVVGEPIVLARGLPAEAAVGLFDLAVHGDVTAITLDVSSDGRRNLGLVRFLTGDVLGPRLLLADHSAMAGLVRWTGDRFRVSWATYEAHFFTRDFDRSGVALTDAIDHGRLAERIGSDLDSTIYLNQAWPDALLFSVGPYGAPRYVSLAADGAPVGPAVALSTGPVLQWRDGRALRRERLFVPINADVDGRSVATLLTFDESTRSIEGARELARGRNLEATSVVGAPDGALLVTVTEPGEGTLLLDVRGGAIARTTLPVGVTHSAWLVDNGSGTAALISYAGRPKDFASALRFSPMRLADRSIGPTVSIIEHSKGIVDARVAAAGCGYAAVWREFAVPPEESFTTKLARITPR